MKKRKEKSYVGASLLDLMVLYDPMVNFVSKQSKG